MRWTSQWAGLAVLMLSLGCDIQHPSDNLSAPEPIGRAQAAIVDGTHGGSSYFRFMPPTVASTSSVPAPNDAKLYPDMEICELVNGQCGAVIWSFSRSNNPPFNRKINPSSTFYAEWQTSLVNLDPARFYRVTVLLDGRALGYADVDVVATAAELSGVDRNNYIGVVKGTNVKLAFWISSGIFTRVGMNGGTVNAAKGNLKLVLPKNFGAEVHIGILNADSCVTAPAGAQIVPCTYYEFLPDGMVLNKPAQLTLKYQDNALPAGVPESALKLLHFSGGQWSVVAGSTVDTQNNSVTGQITGFSGYAVGVLAAILPMSVQVNAPAGPVVVGTPFSAVAQVNNAPAGTSCTLRAEYVNTSGVRTIMSSGSAAVINNQCSVQLFAARAGTANLAATVANLSAQSTDFPVGLPTGTQVQILGVPSGPFFAAGDVPTGTWRLVVRDAAGPIANADVELTASSPSFFNFTGTPTQLFAGRTNASGEVPVPTGMWRLNAVPGVNTVTLLLPGSTTSGTHSITTTSGAAHHLFAAPVPASLQLNAPLTVSPALLDAQGNTVMINAPVTGVLNTSGGPIALGTVPATNGVATFTFPAAPIGYNNTITFSAAGVASHTTNSFMIWGTPEAPTNVRILNPTLDLFNVETTFGRIVGTQPRREVEARAQNLPPISQLLAFNAGFTGGVMVDGFGNMASNTRYEVRARACTNEACSPFSAPVDAITLPGSVMNLRSSVVTNNRIEVIADAVSGDVMETYQFFVGPAGNEQLVCDVASPLCNLPNLNPATAYSWSVRACNASGCGARSPVVTVTTLPPNPPVAPGTPTVTNVTVNTIALSIPNVTFNGLNPRFVVRTAASPSGAPEQLLDVPMTNPSLALFPASVTALMPGTLYEISARACDSNGCSPFSLSAIVPTLQPAPQGIASSGLTSSSAVINWNDPPIPNGAPHNFMVYLQQGSNAQQFVTTVTSPTVTLSGLSANTGYTVEVRACNASGCSPAQHSFTTLPLPAPPAAPNRLQINSQAFNSIVLAWSDNSANEDGFRVMRRVLPSTTFTQIGAVGANVNTFNDTDLMQGLTVVYRVDAFNAGGTSLSNETSTVVPTGQTTPMAPWGTLPTQIGTAGVASPSPARVRLINPSGTAAVGVPVTFTITSPIGSFVQLVPRQTVVVVNTNTSGIATAPAFIVQAGANTVVASATGFNSVSFTVNAN